MTYPILSKANSIEVRNRLVEASTGGIPYPPECLDRNFEGLEKFVEQVGTCHVSSDSLYAGSESLRVELIANNGAQTRSKAAVKGGSSRQVGECLEELMAEKVHVILDQLPAEALYDQSFWRYLALFPFRWYLLEREPELHHRDFGGEDANRQFWLLPRTFSWGQKCFRAIGKSPYENVYAIRDLRRAHGESDGYVVDFYHSHIVRTRWSDDPHVTHGFISTVTSSPPLFDNDARGPVRTLATRVARLSNNLCLPILEESEIATLFVGQR